jgi:hypothetical protein
MPRRKELKPLTEQEKREPHSPKAVQGESFDTLMARLVRVHPDKAKKGSKPAKG